MSFNDPVHSDLKTLLLSTKSLLQYILFNIESPKCASTLNELLLLWLFNLD